MYHYARATTSRFGQYMLGHKQIRFVRITVYERYPYMVRNKLCKSNLLVGISGNLNRFSIIECPRTLLTFKSPVPGQASINRYNRSPPLRCCKEKANPFSYSSVRSVNIMFIPSHIRGKFASAAQNPRDHEDNAIYSYLITVKIFAEALQSRHTEKMLINRFEGKPHPYPWRQRWPTGDGIIYLLVWGFNQ